MICSEVGVDVVVDVVVDTSSPPCSSFASFSALGSRLSALSSLLFSLPKKCTQAGVSLSRVCLVKKENERKFNKVDQVRFSHVLGVRISILQH